MIKNKNRQIRLFGRFSLITLIAVYFLILVGGIVRSTGSGMGCPDWPKCFGQWVPPTQASELPENYKDIYAEKRHQKNVRFAGYLNILGFEKTADQLLSDESIREEATFNATKTWIEYVNRLIGALIGLFILITLVLAFRIYSVDTTSFYMALGTLILVLFQGWIGSIVVSTNLVPWMVSIHMLLALVIVALLVAMVYRVNEDLFAVNNVNTVGIKMIAGLSLLVITIQILLGTQVREEVDVVASAMNYENRGSWIAQLGEVFYIHRSFSWVIIALQALTVYLAKKVNFDHYSMHIVTGIILLSFITGVTMAYFGIPAFAQPVHLLLGALLFGAQFLVFLQLISRTHQTVQVK